MRYAVEVREVFVQRYFVDADSPQEAKDKAHQGLGTADDEGFEFSHRLDSSLSEVSEASEEKGTPIYEWAVKFDSLPERPDALHELVLDLEVEQATNVINGDTQGVVRAIFDALGPSFAEKTLNEIYTDAT